MRPVRIQGADPKPLGAPPDWNEERDGHCGALFIRREVINGVPYMRSAWEGELPEALSMLAGAALHLGIQGTEHPVVQVGVGPLPEDFSPTVVARRFTTITGEQAVRVEMLFPHAGGRRGYVEVLIESTLGEAVSRAVGLLEQLAVKEGWTA